MSSSIDQRMSKSHDHRGGSQQPVAEVEYTYPPQAVAVQGGYHPNTASIGQPAGDPYAMYGPYEPYMHFSGGLVPDPGSVWSTADPNMAAISYGGYSAGTLPGSEYLSYSDGTGEQYGGAPAQYDYSVWFPAGVDYGASWGQGALPMQQQQGLKSRIMDYSNNYYDVSVDSMAGGPAPGANTVGNYGEMNGVHAVDHAFKSMKLSSDDKNSGMPGGEDCVPSVGGSGEGGRFNGGQEAGGNSSSSSSQKKSWANVASQPAKTILLRPKMNSQLPRGVLAVSASVRQESLMNANSGNSGSSNGHANGGKSTGAGESTPVPAVLAQGANQYNPKEFDVSAKNARFFVIKSFSEDDIHRSIKFSIWCSTEYGNKRLDAAFRDREGKGPLYLLFSVNGSGHFCGVAVMTSAVDYHSSSTFWAQNKWKGQFSVRWIFVKDVPNSQLRHIRLENNEGKPVTNSRDTQEVPPEKGRQVLRIIHQYRHTTSIFDDFSHYEKQLEESHAAGGSAPAVDK